MPHEVIIPGRTVVPPGGLITLELRNGNNGRLKKKVTAENAVMDWVKASVPTNAARGWSGNEYTDGLNPLACANDAGLVPNRPFWESYKPVGWYPGTILGALSWLFATPADANISLSELDIPTGRDDAEVTAGVKLSGTFANDGIQLKRGTIVPADCYKTWNQSRVVGTWSTVQGNGTWRSLGFGSLINQEIAPGGLRVKKMALNTGISSGAQNQPSVYSTGSAITGWSVDRAKLAVNTDGAWGRTGTSLVYLDFPSNAVEFTVTAANKPGGAVWSMCDTPTDFWIISAGLLYRCTTPVDASAITVLNTYNLSATVGTVGQQEMAFDGTSLWIMTETDVYEVNPTTGALTGTSWPHGLTVPNPALSIEWDGTQQLLWLNNQESTTGDDLGWGVGGFGQFSWRGTPEPDSFVCHGFTTLGVKKLTTMGAQRSTATDQQTPYRQLNMMTEDGTKCALQASWDASPIYSYVMGPSMASRAVLPADIVKTTDDTMTITYDWNFA